MAYPIAADIKSRSSRIASEESSRRYNVYNKNNVQVTYMVGVSTWTTGKNCDTQATEDTIAYITEQILKVSEDEHLVSWCSRYNNGGTWRADVRFMLCVEDNFCFQNLWDIPCAD